jgi:hypothetical protein
VELDVALGPERLDLSRHRVGTNGQISPRSGWHATILTSWRRPCDGAWRQAEVDREIAGSIPSAALCSAAGRYQGSAEMPPQELE